jgi:hypothetical protein
LAQFDDRFDLLMVLVGWTLLLALTAAPSMTILRLTSILRLGDDFTEQLREVWQVFPQEFGLDNKCFSGVV